MYEKERSCSMALLVCLPEILLLGYFVFGAIGSGIVLPGRFASEDVKLQHEAAWVACALPVLWILGDIVWYGKMLSPTEKRRAVARTLLGLGVVALICSLFLR